MVSEQFPQIYREIPMEYCNGGNNSHDMIAMFNPTRQWSGPAPHDKLNSIAYNVPRRCSMQNDTSPYLHAPGSNVNLINPQSRAHCIQKPPLRQTLSAPQQPMKMEPQHRLLPRPAIIQRADVLPPLDPLDPIAAESPLYKTELCRPWEETGKCKYNSKCQYAHGVQELRHLNRHPKYKTELCRNFHKSAFCRYGPRCTFIHNDDERRGPSQTSPSGLPTPAMLPMSGSSTASSESSGSPSHSPSYLQDDAFTRFTPSPSFGSDGASIAGTVTPPFKHDSVSEESCSLELGLTQFQFAKMNIWMN